MFHQIDDLLARHSTLESANMDLRQQQWRAADLAEKTGCALPWRAASWPLTGRLLRSAAARAAVGGARWPCLSCSLLHGARLADSLPRLLGRADMQAAVKATTDEVLHLNSTISELKKQLEAARRDSHAAASRQSASQAAAADQLRQLGQVRGRPGRSPPCTHGVAG